MAKTSPNKPAVSQQLTPASFKVKTAIVRLTTGHGWYDGIQKEPFKLYEATRAAWSAEKDGQFLKAKIVLCAHNGIVHEVYRVAKWFHANATMSSNVGTFHDPNRWEFVGNVASDPLRSAFLGKPVRSLFRRGDRNPIRTFG